MVAGAADNAGVSLWRQISEALARDIRDGRFAVDERLPKAEELSKRFTVNRHTILRAVQHLQQEGLVRIERGRGAYAVVNPLEFGLGPQQWFEQNLLESNRTPSRKILSIELITATAEIAKPLKVNARARLLFVTILGSADGLPVNLGYHYFALSRLPGIAEAFQALADAEEENFSFSAIIGATGVKDYRRDSIRIRARAPTREEALRLKIAPSDPLIVTSVVSVVGEGQPVVYAHTCYGSSRTELVIDPKR